MKNLICLGAFACAGLVCAAGANAGVMTYTLMDHPDGNASPPPYGLRLDNIFAGLASNSSGTTSFSFDAALNDNTRDNVTLTYDDVMGTIVIEGEVFGGVANGNMLDFGEGWYDFQMTYSVNVSEVGTGLSVGQNDPANTGTLVSQGNADVAAGFTIDLFDQSNNTFLFLQDDHRLAGHPQEGQGFFVGRGWVTTNSDGSNVAGTQDLLFIAVPAPGAAALAGIAGLAATRRRR